MIVFPNPCPVCGATDDHAEWARGFFAAGGFGDLCPHPAERGHGTGCCCLARRPLPSPLDLGGGRASLPADRHGDNRWNRALDALIAAWNRAGPDATLEALTALELTPDDTRETA